MDGSIVTGMTTGGVHWGLLLGLPPRECRTAHAEMPRSPTTPTTRLAMSTGELSEPPSLITGCGVVVGDDDVPGITTAFCMDPSTDTPACKSVGKPAV